MLVTAREERNGKEIIVNEFSISGTPHELRLIANFILKQADELEQNSATYGHCHIQDEIDDWADRCDVIIYGSHY